MPKHDIDCDQIYLDAREKKIEEQLEEELYSFSALIRSHYEFKLFIEDLRIAAAYKKEKIEQLFSGGASPYFASLINRLIDTGREDLIGSISRRITLFLYKDKDILCGEVLSAYPIKEPQRKKLAAAMEKLEKCRVKLRYRTDPNILGGLSISLINGKVWDVSLNQKLETLKAEIIKNA